MRIVICGAGEVGTHTARQLAELDHDITIIDSSADRIASIADQIDVSTLLGNAADAHVLCKAGISEADLLVACTSQDEVNLLSATIAKGMGANKVLARVHHRAFFDESDFDYSQHLGIDRLICPDYSTALAIARTLRSPGAVAIEDFGRGAIEMQEFAVTDGARAIGRPLSEIGIPRGARLAAIKRAGFALIPDASTVIERGDVVVLVGNATVFGDARRLFHESDDGRRQIVIMSGTPLSVWLCRALRDKGFSIRLFEPRRQRAEELGEKLSRVTVIQEDVMDPAVFEEERVAQADTFLALGDDDEDNILACAWAKDRGVPQAIAVSDRINYLQLIHHVGVDHAFSPRVQAAEEVSRLMMENTLQIPSSLAEGIVDIYTARVGENASALGQPLSVVDIPSDWVIVAAQRDGHAHVPDADFQFQVGDTAVVIGRHGLQDALEDVFGTEKL